MSARDRVHEENLTDLVYRTLHVTRLSWTTITFGNRQKSLKQSWNHNYFKVFFPLSLSLSLSLSHTHTHTHKTEQIQKQKTRAILRRLRISLTLSLSLSLSLTPPSHQKNSQIIQNNSELFHLLGRGEIKDFFRCCDGDEEAEEIDKQEREERDDANAIATSDAKHWTEVALGPLFPFPPLWISLHPSTKDFHPCRWVFTFLFCLFGDVFHPWVVPTYLIAFD